MDRIIINVFLFIICVISIIVSYKFINSELENTVLTPTNTKSQPCPDYWTYDSESKLCYDPDNNSVDFSDFTFCDKQQYSKNPEDPENPIAWNGISNVVNPKCEHVVISYNDNTPEVIYNEYFYIHYIYFYSLLIMLIVILEYIFNNKGNRGRIFVIFFLCVLIELLLYYILGIDIQFMLFGKRYNNEPNPKNDNRDRCYNWSCLFN